MTRISSQEDLATLLRNPGPLQHGGNAYYASDRERDLDGEYIRFWLIEGRLAARVGMRNLLPFLETACGEWVDTILTTKARAWISERITEGNQPLFDAGQAIHGLDGIRMALDQLDASRSLGVWNPFSKAAAHITAEIDDRGNLMFRLPPAIHQEACRQLLDRLRNIFNPPGE
jgi:hypothetical protein